MGDFLSDMIFEDEFDKDVDGGECPIDLSSQSQRCCTEDEATAEEFLAPWQQHRLFVDGDCSDGWSMLHFGGICFR